MQAVSLPSKSSSIEVTRVELFRLLSEEARLRILALCAEEELSVSELATALGDSQPQVSRKCAALREAGLMVSRREGTRTFLRTALTGTGAPQDSVVAEAVAEGRRLCLGDGSLARIPQVIAAREEHGRTHFEMASPAAASVPASPEHLAHLSALSLLLPQRHLAVDVGTGDGLSLDVLAPLFQRVLAVDRSQAQLARVAERIAARGFHQVSLFPGSYDDAAFMERVDAAGGADLVFAGRTLHHASRPAQAVNSFARLLKRGGVVVVLDYLKHHDEAMRSESGDVWLGFSVDEVRRFLVDAHLRYVGDCTISKAFHPQGVDANLQWHAWAGQRPIGSKEMVFGMDVSTTAVHTPQSPRK